MVKAVGPRMETAFTRFSCKTTQDRAFSVDVPLDLWLVPVTGGEGSAVVRPLSHEDGDGGELSAERHREGGPRGARLLPGGRRPDPGNRGVE